MEREARDLTKSALVVHSAPVMRDKQLAAKGSMVEGERGLCFRLELLAGVGTS